MSGTASREIDPGPLARTPEEWAALVQTMGGRPFHGKQVFRWIHARGVVDPALMSDLPAALRERLVAEGVGAPMEIASERRAHDATRKLLVRMRDGATVETVLIPGVSGGPNGLRSPVSPRGPTDLREGVPRDSRGLTDLREGVPRDSRGLTDLREGVPRDSRGLGIGNVGDDRAAAESSDDTSMDGRRRSRGGRRR